MNIERLVADERLVALTRRQDLEPVECEPDTVPSEGNRMDGAFAGELAHLDR